jgi:Flp pilus assembly protein TadG
MKIRIVRSERGSALIETALTLPLLLMMLLGAVELARVACAAIEVSNAAKAAAAYGAQNHSTQEDLSGIELAATDDVDKISGLTFTGTGVKSFLSGVCSSGNPCTGPDNGSGPTCRSDDCGIGDHAETILTISTSGTIDPLIHLPGLPSTYTVQGSAVQTVLQP